MVATSANLPGGPDPRRSTRCLKRSAQPSTRSSTSAPLPGTPSTVIDFTGSEPVVLREGAASADEALRLVGPVL